ncbi:MAG: hypothetical protein WAV47_10315 [Blastocatellia bacterium]
MKTERRMLVAISLGVAVLVGVAGVAAQATQERSARQEVVVAQGGVVVAGSGSGVGYGFGSGGGQGDNTFVFVSSEMSVDGKLVKGAPYSAQAVTETIQTLADGNRIVRRNTASVYRDGEGRTRREQTIGSVGAYAAAGEPQQTIFINDPVAEVNYVLDAKTRVARKISLNGMGEARKKMAEGMKARGPEEGNLNAELREKAAAEVKGEMMSRVGPPPMRGEMPRAVIGGFGGEVMFNKVTSKNTKKESLGKQTIEGVEAEGTRFTTTIAAGEIGNEAPINIISESWYSPELQTVVQSRHSDPRIGETTYRLISIDRSEPAHSLFEVPSDYTVRDTTVTAPMRFKLESELKRSGAEKKEQ